MYLSLAHTRLDIYKLSKLLVIVCYKETNGFPTMEKFALTQQIRRAALSIHLNIAEGCSRKSPAERRRFFEISRSSLIEVDTAIDIAAELGYFQPTDQQQLGSYISRCFLMLTKLIQQTS